MKISEMVKTGRESFNIMTDFFVDNRYDPFVQISIFLIVLLFSLFIIYYFLVVVNDDH